MKASEALPVTGSGLNNSFKEKLWYLICLASKQGLLDGETERLNMKLKILGKWFLSPFLFSFPKTNGNTENSDK